VAADQAPPTPGVGHDYTHFLNETVNPSNGSVSIRISVPTPSGRELTVPFSFGYDSNAAYHKTGPLQYWDNSGYISKGGWSYVLPQLWHTTHSYTYMPPNGGLPGPSTCSWFNDFVMQDVGSVTHQLGQATFQPNNTARCQYFAGKPADYLTGGDVFIQSVTDPYNTIPQTTRAVSLDGTVYHFTNQGQFMVNNVTSELPDWIET